ncbi:MAG: aminotransferase class V-fold PLP-dependent enzyme [Coriobacteriaceae bacterium]|nr:aminotransferase class V-fold PLP-dependent enzyme [Coriobacteriaceae bacterium]
MIYFDNAATTCPKPPQVAEAISAALDSFGGVGRGVHGASLAAGMGVYEARSAVADLFNAPSASRVAFTSNITEALNIAISGLLGAGQHAVTTAASHNSVLRPLYRAQADGAELDIAPIRADGSLDTDAFEALLRPDTRLVVLTHASNLTGDIYDVATLTALAHERGALVVLDTAQTAGFMAIDQAALGIDVLTFTGHKSLFGPQGTGGLCVAEGVEIPPFKVGGTGVHSFDKEQPAFMPERLEAGTLNGHGIAGLAAGITFIQDTGIEAIAEHDRDLADRFREGIADLDGLRILGGGSAAGQTPIVAIDVDDVDAGLISDRLNTEWEICTRAGAHCAPLMHEALGTADQGAVRFSFSYFNTADEIDVAIDAMTRIVGELRS